MTTKKDNKAKVAGVKKGKMDGYFIMERNIDKKTSKTMQDDIARKKEIEKKHLRGY